MDLNWAIIGTGTISRSVVPDFRQCSNTRISVVHSRSLENARAFAAEFDISRSTSSYADILDDPDVDALYIATPFSTHHELTLAALNADKHVLVEKPMATTSMEVVELFETAAANDVFVMEGMWMKFNPAFRLLHEEIQNGTIGEPRNLRAAFSFPFPQDGGSRWDINRSGSTLLDQGIYPVTLAHSLFGLPSAVHAVGTVRADGVDLSQHFTLEFDGGRFAQCVSGMTEFADPSAAVSGQFGWISLPAPFWSTTSLDVHAGASYESLFDPPRRTLEKEGNGRPDAPRGHGCDPGWCEAASHSRPARHRPGIHDSRRDPPSAGTLGVRTRAGRRTRLKGHCGSLASADLRQTTLGSKVRLQRVNTR